MKKNSSNKVSIIVPIYNVEQYLPKCLDSLINQTFKDIEIWAISEGSPDNSVDIKVDLAFTVQLAKNTEINIIDDINEDENRKVENYSMIIYFVKPGDTLWNIAKKYKTSVDKIVMTNNIENPDSISVGDKLLIIR